MSVVQNQLSDDVLGTNLTEQAIIAAKRPKKKKKKKPTLIDEVKHNIHLRNLIKDYRQGKYGGAKNSQSKGWKV